MENTNHNAPKTCPICGCILEDGHTAMGTLDNAPAMFCDDCAGNYVTCEDCGSIIQEDDAITTHAGDYICQNCYDDEYFTCECCDEVHHLDDLTHVNQGFRDELYVCDECASASYYRCDDCGAYVSAEHLAMGDGTTYICDDCADNWATCADCGDVISMDDAYTGDDDEYYCSNCIDDHRRSASVHDYSYKPYPEIQRVRGELDDAPTYGVELEVDDGGDVNDLADELDGMGEPIYCKHDGSLDDGLEIVTHPATLRFHLERMDWDGITQTCRDCGFRSHDTSTCGLHVHIGRNSHKVGWAGNLTALCCALQDELTVFSRRRPNALQRWSAWNWPKASVNLDADDAELSAQLLDLYADSYRRGRYQAVNLQNRHTVELRLFRGTLRTDTIRATLELVDALAAYADAHTLTECARATWTDLAENFTAPELLEYCDARELWAPAAPAESIPA